MKATKPRWANRAVLIKTLVYFDGPQIALLRSDRGRDMLAVHVPRGDIEYGMFACEISKAMLSGYLNEKFDLRYVFTKPEAHKRFYFFDWEALDEMVVHLVRAKDEEIRDDENYPDTGFFARNHTVDIEIEEGAELDFQKYKIDGNWAASDFSRFYGKIADMYAFLSLPKLTENSASQFDATFYKQLIGNYLWRGGGSYVGFYDAMFARVQNLLPLNVSKIRYASPGYIELNGGGDRLRDIEHILDAYSINKDKIHQTARLLDNVLRVQGLKRAERGISFTTVEVEKNALTMCISLAQMLSVKEADKIFDLCGKDSVVFSKIMLSFFRRTRDLYVFHAEGRVQTTDEAIESVADA